MAVQNLLDDAKGLITFLGHLSADLVCEVFFLPDIWKK
jgi:hypothetical protein